jgi:hypothetical protein
MENNNAPEQTYESSAREIIESLRGDIRKKIVPFIKERLEKENKLKEDIKSCTPLYSSSGRSP